jgi:hypothetical protein
MLNAAARAVITSGALAHLFTINKDGPPGARRMSRSGLRRSGSALLDGLQKKLGNRHRDPWVVLSFVAEGVNGVGMGNGLVVRRRARISEGALPSCCRPSRKPRAGLGQVPSHVRPAPGFITHVAITWFCGLGAWPG